MYELILLDLLLPALNGMAVLTKILKADPEQKVLILSALTAVPLKVRCLEAGATDYLPKPFDLAELLARVRARLRHSNGQPAHPQRVLSVGQREAGAAPADR